MHDDVVIGVRIALYSTISPLRGRRCVESTLIMHLGLQGIQNAEYYLKNVDVIFSDRGNASEEFAVSAYDVVVRLNVEEDPVPPYIYDCIVKAVRKSQPENAVFLNVQIMACRKSWWYPVHNSFAPLVIGLNNCVFHYGKTLEHDDLRFRSQAEVVIYKELKTRNVLFFPNPAAVFGTTGAEYGAMVERKEPDFLICLKGKWGVLEINGDDFHSGIVQTVKDHERARLFQKYGVYFIQAYSADQCKKDAVAVVDQFLQLLANHR